MLDYSRQTNLGTYEFSSPKQADLWRRATLTLFNRLDCSSGECAFFVHMHSAVFSLRGVDTDSVKDDLDPASATN